MIPKEEDFYKAFRELTYSKRDNADNLKTKYAINKINLLYSNKVLFEDDGSIEHIISESDGNKLSLNIGNLILIEGSINTNADNKNYEEKLKEYEKSNYKWVQKFIEINTNWNLDKVEDRTRKLSKQFYSNYLLKIEEI